VLFIFFSLIFLLISSEMKFVRFKHDPIVSQVFFESLFSSTGGLFGNYNLLAFLRPSPEKSRREKIANVGIKSLISSFEKNGDFSKREKLGLISEKNDYIKIDKNQNEVRIYDRSPIYQPSHRSMEMLVCTDKFPRVAERRIKTKLYLLKSSSDEIHQV
jgi:hypothetical protein